jgi:hypothetical protein
MTDGSLRLRAGCVAAALIALTACSSPGGGASSSVPAAGQAVTSAGMAAAAKHHPKTPSKARQRALAGAALTLAGNSLNVDQFGSTNGLLAQLFDFGRANEHVRHDASSSSPRCFNGVEHSWSSNGSGQLTQTIEFFYDSACTQPYLLIDVAMSFGSSGITAKGSQETWAQNGNVIGYKTFTATLSPGNPGTSGSIQVEEASAPAPSEPPTSQSGFTCLLHTSAKIDCGTGNTITLPSASPAPAEIGFTQTTVGSVVTPSPSPTPTPSSGSSSGSGSSSKSALPANWGHGEGNWQGGPSGLELTVNGTGYTGGVGSLTLAPGTPPAWTIAGGTQVATLTGTATIGFGGFEHSGRGWRHDDGRWGRGGHGQPGPGSLTSLDLTLNDTAAGLTATLTSAADGKLTGTVTETGSTETIATISVNVSGNGTITYSNGTTETVQDWIILN